MKILVLGAMGFIGKSLVSALKSRYELALYDRNINDNLGVEKHLIYYEGDFKKEQNWDELLKDVDIVIHLISTTNVNSGTEYIESEITHNIIPTIRLLDAMRRMGVRKMIFVSSGGTVYGLAKGGRITENTPLNPICPYGVQKKTIESYLTLYNYLHGMQNIIMRVGNPYGLGQNVNRMQGIIPIFIDRILRKEPLTIWGDGNNIRDYIYMDDLIRAFEAVINYQGKEEIFNVGSGCGYSINEIINIICEELEVKELHIEYTKARNVDVPFNVLDNERIFRETGWKPQIDIYQGIHRLHQQIRR